MGDLSNIYFGDFCIYQFENLGIGGKILRGYFMYNILLGNFVILY